MTNEETAPPTPPAPPSRPAPSRQVRDARTLITQTVAERVSRAEGPLKAVLPGTVLFSITDRAQAFLIDFKTSAVTEVAPGTSADCVLAMTEGCLMRVSSGQLNPQIAILAGKITVSGQTNLAMYAFNVVAPGGAS